MIERARAGAAGRGARDRSPDSHDSGSVDRIAEAIRGDIQSGSLAGGESLHESQLAIRFGVSRTPVREAVARLVAEGLLIKAGGRNGLTVFRPSVAELREIYEIRLNLESMAAELAAGKRTHGAVRALAQRLDHLGSATGTDWLRAHHGFHMAVYECAGRARLSSLIEQFRSQSEPYLRFYVGLRPREILQSEHDRIVRALRAGDPQAAAAATRQHLMNTLRELEDWLQSDH